MENEVKDDVSLVVENKVKDDVSLIDEINALKQKIAEMSAYKNEIDELKSSSLNEINALKSSVSKLEKEYEPISGVASSFSNSERRNDVKLGEIKDIREYFNKFLTLKGSVK